MGKAENKQVNKKQET